MVKGQKRKWVKGLHNQMGKGSAQPERQMGKGSVQSERQMGKGSV